MNQALGFGILGVGGIFLYKSVTGSSFSSIVQGRPNGATGTAASAASAGVGGLGQALAGASSSAGSVTTQDLASIGSAFGWTGSQISDWMGVINKESGGRLTAQNPTSNAYGIAQFINGPSEYYSYGGNPNTTQGQLTAMANYIKQRYGTPSAALAHENSAGWY